MNFLPIAGSVRMWLIDECHKLTGDAQNSMLKMLEDTPAHVYFLLCTTDPQKLIKTIRTRATEIKLVPLSHQELEQLIKRVVQKEGFKVSDDIVEEIAEASDGSARKALVLLEQIADLDSEEEQLKAIVAANFNKDDAFTLARLVFNFRRDATWTEVAKTLRNLSDQDVEGIRYCMLGYARSVLVGKDDKPPNTKYAQKAFGIIEIFGRNFYDSKHAGLAGACWEAFNNLK
jgi:DNA polymerase III gamma/tau subunit